MRGLFYVFIGLAVLMTVIAYLFVSQQWPNNKVMPWVAVGFWLISLILFFLTKKRA